MIISKQFNRFFFSLINDCHTQLLAGKNIVLTQKRFREVLKERDINYPIDKSLEKLSLAKLDNKQLIKHIEFIIRFMGEEFGITPLVIEEEWDRLLAQAEQY